MYWRERKENCDIKVKRKHTIQKYSDVWPSTTDRRTLCKQCLWLSSGFSGNQQLLLIRSWLVLMVKIAALVVPIGYMTNGVIGAAAEISNSQLSGAFVCCIMNARSLNSTRWGHTDLHRESWVRVSSASETRFKLIGIDYLLIKRVVVRSMHPCIRLVNQKCELKGWVDTEAYCPML